MTYAPVVVARGLYLYLSQDKPSLREAHRLLTMELRQKGAKAPTRRVFDAWAKRGEWATLKVHLAKQVAAATGESLAQLRARRLKQVNRVIDAAFTLDEKGDAKFLGGKAPGSVLAKLIEVADRLAGGGEKVLHEGEVHVSVHEALAPKKPRKRAPDDEEAS